MRRRKRRQALQPDLTPLIDVIFLLIIFFMISSTFNNYGNIPIELPSSTVEKKQEKQPMEIVLDKDGNCYISENGKNEPIAMKDLGSRLAGVKEVTIAADKNLKYQLVMDVMTKVKENNIENMGLTFYE